MRQKLGEPNIIKIDKIFSTAREAIDYEVYILQYFDVKNSTFWLNGHNGDGKFVNKGGYKLSNETKQKMSKPKASEHRKKIAAYAPMRNVGRPSHGKGKKRPGIGGRKPGCVGLKGRVVSEETKKAQSVAALFREKTLCLFCNKMTIGGHSERCSLNPNREELNCPHCNVVGKGGGMWKHHFKNCKKNPII
jgi:hypothetical protein